VFCAEAAVELLIGHRWWLCRDDFVARFVGSTPGPVGEVMAWVDWEGVSTALDAGRLGCSSSEAQILAIAASVAAGVPVALGDAVTGLDDRNISLVAAAVVHAGCGRSDTAAVKGW
jgi:hypothetical protein